VTLANDSFQSAPDASGTLIATHLVGSKEYQVMMAADATGNIIGSRDDWIAYLTPGTNATAREAAELFNADATAIVRVRGIWVIPTQTAITGAQIGFDINRITSKGTTGLTAVTPRPMDKSQAALNANITAGFGSTAGGALDVLLWQVYFFNEETNASVALQATYNQLPIQGDHPVEIVLRQNQGIQVKQSVASAVGLTGVLIYFTVE
jgi:hypothetical protein